MSRYLRIARAALREKRAEDPKLGPVALPPGFGAADAWPPECLESLRRFHRPPVLVAPHAILFPLLGKRVLTPKGPGRLVQVFASLATVALDAYPGRAAVFEPQELRPVPERRPRDDHPTLRDAR